MRQFSASIVTIPQHLPGWQSGHLLLKPKASRKQQRAVIDFLSLLLMGYRLRYTVEIDIWGADTLQSDVVTTLEMHPWVTPTNGALASMTTP